MKTAVDKVLDGIAYDKRKRPGFADAVLTQQAGSYLWYRSKYFLIKTFLLVCFHVLEFYLLFELFSFGIAMSILVLRLFSRAASSYWWGVLEVMRDQIRQLKQSNEKEKIYQVVQVWRKQALIYCCVATLCYSGFVLWQLHHLQSQYVQLILLYVMIIAFEINGRVYVQMWHSSCFSVARIYRPFYSIMGPMVAALVVLFTLWPLCGGYALPLSTFVQITLSLYWTWKYTHRMIQFKGIFKRYVQLVNKPVKQTYSMVSLSGLASLCMDGSAILILIILHDYINFYLLAPLIAACFTWSKLLYFDNVKYRAHWFMLLMKRFNLSCQLFSIMIAFILTLASSTVLHFFSGIQFWVIVIPLFLFFSTRLLLSIQNIIFFSKQHYQMIVISSLVFFVMAIIVALLSLSFVQTLVGLAVLQAGIYLCLLRLRHRYMTTPPGQLMPFFSWLDAVQPHENIYLFKIKPDCNVSTKRGITKTLSECAHQKMRLSMPNDTHCYCAVPPYIHIPNAWIAKQLGSYVQRCDFPVSITEILGEALSLDRKTVLHNFKKQFQTGIILDLQKISQDGLLWGKQYETASVLEKLYQYLQNPLMLTRNSTFYLSAYYQDQQVDAIFIVPKTSVNDVEVMRSWYSSLFKINLGNINPNE